MFLTAQQDLLVQAGWCGYVRISSFFISRCSHLLILHDRALQMQQGE